MGDEPPRPHVQPPAGWYPDPTDQERNRYWSGTEWTAEQQDPWTAPSDEQQPRSRITVPRILIVLFAGLAVWGFVDASDPDPDNRSPSEMSAAAFGVCQDFVRDRLRSPSSAEFGPYSESLVRVQDSTHYRVRSVVDSQNGFGAMLRSAFTCTVRYAGGSSWRLIGVTFDE